LSGLSATTNPITYGGPATFTVTLSPNNPAPFYGAGTVQFKDTYNGSTVSLGYATPVYASGATTASFTTPAASPLGGGSHNIIAVFIGDTNYGASTPVSFAFGVNKASLTTAANFSVSPGSITSIAYGGTMPTATATLTAINSTGAALPTGTYTSVQAGTYTLEGPLTISNGAARFDTVLPTTLPPNATAYGLNFNYSGDANYNSAVFTQSSYLKVDGAVPTATLVSSGNPVAPNVSLTFTLTLTTPTTGTPTGSVAFKDGTTTIGTSSLSGSGGIAIASFSTSSLTPGNHTITAVYSGDTNFTVPATTPTITNQVVNSGNTSITVTPSTTTVPMGQTVTFSFTVTATQPNGAPTGSVTIYDNAGGGTLVCTTSALTPSGNTASGSCQLTYDGSNNTLMSKGVHNLYAQYTSSNTNVFANATSSTFSVSVGLTRTTISTVSSTAATTCSPAICYVLGTPTDLSVTLTATTGPPPAFAGNVNFYDGATLIGTAVPNGSGVATLSAYYFKTGGAHSVYAQFQGDTNYSQSANSATLPITVTVSTPTMALYNNSTPPSTAVFGTTFGIPVKITGLDTKVGYPVPTGTITVTLPGPVTVGTGTLDNNGAATINIPLLPPNFGAGPYTISVAYLGDTNYAAIAPTSWTLTITPATATPSFTATYASAPPLQNLPLSSGGAVPYGDSVSFSVALSGVTLPHGTLFPTGSIGFTDENGNAIACTVMSLTAGVAVCPTTATGSIFGQNNGGNAIGNHAVKVTGLTDPNFALPAPGASPSFLFSIAKASSATTATSGLNPSKPGDTVTLSAQVSVVPPGNLITLGTGGQQVTFYNAGAPVSGTCTNLQINASGQASCTFAFQSAGNYNITAQFSGDGNLAPSTSVVFAQSVGHPQPQISLTSSNANANFGTPVTFTATVTGTNSITPVGQMEFTDGSNVLGVVNLAAISPAGTASACFTVGVPAVSGCGNVTTPLTAGNHAIYATYIPNGDNNYATITSQALTQIVTGTTTQISPVTISASPAVYGQNVTLSVTVSPAVQPSNATPTGSVVFCDGATGCSQTVALTPNSGTNTASASVTVSTASLNAPQVGTHSAIFAKYIGDANFGPVTSTNATLVVNRATTQTTISPGSTSSAAFGGAVSVTATVAMVCPANASCPLPLVPTNSITFFDGATGNPLGPAVQVSNTGSATLNITANNPPFVNPLQGTHNIIAVYNGGTGADPNFTSSTSPSFALSIGKVATTTTVTSSTGPSPSQSVYGQSVTFTATVAAGAGTYLANPTGTITFANGGVPLGTATLSTFGQVTTASLTVPSTGVPVLPVGNNVISASYAGDTNYAASSSPATGASAFQQKVIQSNTTTQLSSSTNSSVTGQTVTLTAVVTVNQPGSGAPTGIINFYDTVNNVPTLLGTGQLNPAPGTNAANQFLATLNLSSLPTGSLELTAVYPGDNNFVTSTSAIVTQAVSKPTVSVTLTENINPSIYGTPVTFTATITPVAPATGTPTGTAQFFDGTVSMASQALVGGQATWTATLLPGMHNIAVSYSGDAGFQGFISTAIPATVNRIPSSISLTTNSVTAVASQVVTYTAQVSPTPPAGVPFASGQIAFMDGSVQIGVGQLSSGVATVSTSTLLTGLHEIQAIYTGDSAWAGATSQFIPQTVTSAITATTASSSVNPSVWGQPVTFTVASTVAFPGTVPAVGQIQLFDNAVAVGNPVTINNGVVQITVPTLAPGTHNIIAQYVGNMSYSTSSSPALTQTVNKAPTVTTVGATPNSSTSNQEVTLTAVVSVPSPGAGSPSGTVQFLDATSNIILGTAPLSQIGGVYTASINTSQLNQSGAPRLLTATYSGDVDFATSTSQAQLQTVNGTQIAVTNAAGYTQSNFAPDSAAAIFVNNIVTSTMVSQNLPLPTSLGGVTVTLTDSAGVQQQAQLYFVSPTQINFMVPTKAAFGLATVTVTNSGGATASGIILVTHTAPGLFAANQNGQGIAAGQLYDGAASGANYLPIAQYNSMSQAWIAAPITMTAGDTYILQLYGTGLRYASGGQVSATIAGQTVQVLYAGAQPQYPGLDQVNLQIPASMKGAGTVQIVVTVNGQAANTVTITLN
jgi:hypothetical protein